MMSNANMACALMELKRFMGEEQGNKQTHTQMNLVNCEQCRHFRRETDEGFMI